MSLKFDKGLYGVYTVFGTTYSLHCLIVEDKNTLLIKYKKVLFVRKAISPGGFKTFQMIKASGRRDFQQFLVVLNPVQDALKNTQLQKKAVVFYGTCAV